MASILLIPFYVDIFRNNVCKIWKVYLVRYEQKPYNIFVHNNWTLVEASFIFEGVGVVCNLVISVDVRP